MTTTTEVEAYHDPFDFDDDIDAVSAHAGRVRGWLTPRGVDLR